MHISCRRCHACTSACGASGCTLWQAALEQCWVQHSLCAHAAMLQAHLQCDSFSSSELLLLLSPSRSESRRSSTYFARLAARRCGSALAAAGEGSGTALQQHAWQHMGAEPMQHPQSQHAAPVAAVEGAQQRSIHDACSVLHALYCKPRAYHTARADMRCCRHAASGSCQQLRGQACSISVWDEHSSSLPGAAFLPLRLAGLLDSSLSPSLLLAFFFAFFLAPLWDSSLSLTDAPSSVASPADLYSDSGSDSEACSETDTSSGDELLRRFGMCEDWTLLATHGACRQSNTPVFRATLS